VHSSCGGGGGGGGDGGGADGGMLRRRRRKGVCNRNHGNGFGAAAAENFIRGCYIPFNHAAAPPPPPPDMYIHNV